ncbi:hypothetical protein OF83DRAFT_1287480 [Amylostereum chailletii]|nr:hypothetical protein OF83DRAFT_1287480 [Amylostereum chailletii]
MAEPTPKPDIEYISDQEIAAMAARMRVADPDHDYGEFSSTSRLDALILLKLIGVKGLSSNSPYSAEDILQKLRLALWDVQRLDLLFPGKTLGGSEKLDIDSLPSWPDWKKKHVIPGFKQGGMTLDGYKDADKLDSYVFRHFQMSAFTQTENLQHLHANPSPDMRGAWYGVKNAMTTLGLDITQEGGDELPFFACYTTGTSPHILVAEVLDVKQAEWPEPTQKLWTLIRDVQETKFGHPADGPLVPMMRTPKFPVIIVRYTYMEGRPKEGSQLMEHLQARFMKEGSTLRQAREKLQLHLRTGLEMPEVHMRTFARILSSNSDLLDPEYKTEMQSHWKGISREVAKETRISFVAPCLRLRWRALEELETGVPPSKFTACNKCGETGKKLTCGSCKSVYYCNADCNKADWPKHKEVCKFSKRLLNPNSGLPANKFYLPLRTYQTTILDTGFAIEQEMIRQSGTAAPEDCPPNEYGEERFILRVNMPFDYAVGAHKGQTMFVWDRRRSLCARAGPGEVLLARERGTSVIPFDRAGHARLMELVRRRGVQGQALFVWGKRVGDCAEIDLADFPPRSIFWE